MFIEQLIPLFGIVFGCSIPIVIVCASLYYKHRRDALWHETARIALEKGQPIPQRLDSEGAGLDVPPPTADAATWLRMRREARRLKDIRGGLILLAIGFAFLVASRHGSFLGSQGLFPAFILLGIGAALLLNALFNALFSGKWEGNRPPPQA